MHHCGGILYLIVVYALFFMCFVYLIFSNVYVFMIILRGVYMKINVNLDESLVKKIDERAKAMYISRSAYISTALSEKLRQDELVANLPKMFDTFEKIKDSLESQSGKGNGDE